MSNLYQTLQEEIKCLPPKDYALAVKLLNERKFEPLYEIVDSCYKLKLADDAREVHKEKWQQVNVDDLLELRADLTEYMSYLDIPDNTDEYDEY